MDDLKSVTMSYLRDLARKHLGTGYSKLNKKELIAALAEFVPALKKLARLAGVELTAGSKPAAKAAAPATKQPRAPSRGKETSAVDKKKKEPEKKAAAPKKEPEKKAAPEAKKAPEKKAAPEAKKEPEKKAAPEAKKAPEKKAAPEAKKEPEKKAAPEPKKEPEKEPETKAAAPQSRKAPASRQSEPKDEDAASRRPAQVVNFPPRVRLPRSAEEVWQEDTAEMVVESPELEQVFQHAAEPLVEGFFVARMMGERELRRHHLTEEQSPRPTFNGSALGYNEDLGELPLDYGNDLALALARDPHTLFITWDFSPATRARAMEGLDEPRAMLRVFDGERLVRELEIALESRSFYIHGLPPGRPYRVEAHFVARSGRSRRIGSSTHPLTLPRTGASPDKTVRFMQLPPPPIVPVQGVPPPAVVTTALPREAQGEEQIEERQYITWHRVPLPGSADLAAVPVSWRERTSRRGEGAGLPEHLEVTARPPGSSEQSVQRREGAGLPEHLELPLRPPGSSEQSVRRREGAGLPEHLEFPLRPPGSSEQMVRRGENAGPPEHLEFPLRPPGSSEQMAGGGGAARGGASEQTHWTPPPSGRGR